MFSIKDCLSQKISEIFKKKKLLIMKPIDKNMKEPDFNRSKSLLGMSEPDLNMKEPDSNRRQ
jgi:hypothetical protein